MVAIKRPFGRGTLPMARRPHYTPLLQEANYFLLARYLGVSGLLAEISSNTGWGLGVGVTTQVLMKKKFLVCSSASAFKVFSNINK